MGLNVAESPNSGPELWRLLISNFERASSFNIVSALESIKNSKVNQINDVLGDITTIDTAHQNYERPAEASKESELTKMRVHGSAQHNPRRRRERVEQEHTQ